MDRHNINAGFTLALNIYFHLCLRVEFRDKEELYEEQMSMFKGYLQTCKAAPIRGENLFREIFRWDFDNTKIVDCGCQKANEILMLYLL